MLRRVATSTSRPEHEIFADLSSLCTKPGFVHALAYICFRDNIIPYAGKMKEADMRKMFDPSRLIRSEINTLIGLMVKAKIGWELPNPKDLQECSDRSYQLLEELHHSMSGEFLKGVTAESIADGTFDPFKGGEAMREPIFYSGESAYNFQYRALAGRRYEADAAWLQQHHGFDMKTASTVAEAVEQVHANRFVQARDKMRTPHPDQWTMLPFFAVTVEEVAAQSGLETALVTRILDAFTLSEEERNAGFNALHDFNAISATPLLRMPSGEYLSLQAYALAEALYDAPFYWMAPDKAYRGTLAKNRGDFTESFVTERLTLVFGPDRLFRGVDIYAAKGVKAGEIDTHVLWGNRAIVVQAKSKRLTIEARKGNDLVIRDDFKKSVQDAYDQAVGCAQRLGDSRYVLKSVDGRTVELPYEIEEIYVVCVVSDHYPALSFQTRHFLKTTEVARVQPPMVMDVFAIDAMTEMLQSPLHFLSYLNRRVTYGDKLLASQELTILAYHLQQNLWLESETGLMHLHDDFSAGLDIAMAVRRTGMEGAATPPGIFTRHYHATTLGHVIKEIEARPEPAIIDLGFLLLAASEDTLKTTSRAIDRLAALARGDGQHHDMTIAFGTGEAGLTIHLNDDPQAVALQRLNLYCTRRKYKERAARWFGLCMRPKDCAVRFGVSVTFPWRNDESMEEDTRDMQQPQPVRDALSALMNAKANRKKIGRNDPCPCGSGLKYKKCHLL